MGRLTTGQAARALDVSEWRVVRLFKTGRVAEPSRLGNLRSIGPDELKALSAELVRDGIPHMVPTDIAGE